MGVSKNNGTPKSSIFIGFYIINHPFWGTPRFGNTHIVQESNRWMPCHLQWGSSCRCEGALGPGFAGKNLWSSNVVLIKVNVTTSTDQKILGSKFPSQGYFNYCTLLCFLCFFVAPYISFVFSNASFRGFSFGEPIFVGFVPGQSLWLCPNGRLQSRHGGGDEATPWSDSESQ